MDKGSQTLSDFKPLLEEARHELMGLVEDINSYTEYVENVEEQLQCRRWSHDKYKSSDILLDTIMNNKHSDK